MSQFEGGNKVRCVDCTRLAGTRCGVKDATVSVRKRRTCTKYSFIGEYDNRTPANSIYIPPVSKETKRLLKRLSKLGVMPVGDDGNVRIKGDFYRKGTVPVPVSTATARVPDPINEDQKQRWVQATSAVDPPDYAPEEVEDSNE